MGLAPPDDRIPGARGQTIREQLEQPAIPEGVDASEAAIKQLIHDGRLVINLDRMIALGKTRRVALYERIVEIIQEGGQMTMLNPEPESLDLLKEEDE